MSNKPMLSILTNFGCHFACSYCVYRENGIKIPKTDVNTFGWNELEEQLKIHKGELISISGGGDPLYNFSSENSHYFYIKLFELIKKYDCKVELHTSIYNEWFPYNKCERVVFHFTMPNQIRLLSSLDEETLYLTKNIRVVYVIQEHYSKHLIQEIVREVNSSEIVSELSFRQMIDKNGETTYYLHDYLKEGHKKEWYYIEQADYNEYFVNDHIEREYLEIK